MIVFPNKQMVRTTLPSSRNAKYNLFFRLAVPSLRKIVEGEIRPARMDCATCYPKIEKAGTIIGQRVDWHLC
jgi:hypothetical protein